MTSRSPEPLIDFTNNDGSSDSTSIGSNSSTSSVGGGVRRKPPLPPPNKPLLVRSNTSSDILSSNTNNNTKRPLPPPPPPASKKPLPPTPPNADTKPAPPPKPRPGINRTLSTPPSARRPLVQDSPLAPRSLPSPPPTQDSSPPTRSPPSPPTRSLPSKPPPAQNSPPPPRPLPQPPTRGVSPPPTRSPPPPPPRQISSASATPPKKPQRSSVHIDHALNKRDSTPQLTPTPLIKQSSKGEIFNKVGTTPMQNNEVSRNDSCHEVQEGTLVDLSSPPSTPVKLVSLTSQTSFRRQPVCLPKPASRDLEYEEKEHPKNAFKKLAMLREKGELCDCVLSVGDTEIRAHRIVLASCSPYFESMFIGEFSEPEGIPVVIEEVDELALSTLINFAYTSRITLSHGNVYTLFEAADILEFPGVKNACFKFFRSQMNKTNCIRTWLFAESHNCTELLSASLKYIEVNFLNIVRGREFMAIEPETVSRILSLENIAITCEEQVYEAAIEWINYDPMVRKGKQALEVLSNVRFPSINRDYLVHITDNEAIIRDDPDCLQLVITAIESHMSNVRGTLMRKMKSENSKLLPRAAAMAVEVREREGKD